jgi:hypothetical protein
LSTSPLSNFLGIYLNKKIEIAEGADAMQLDGIALTVSRFSRAKHNTPE